MYNTFADKTGKVYRLTYDNNDWLTNKPLVTSFNNNSLIYIPSSNWTVTSGNDASISPSEVTPYYPTNFFPNDVGGGVINPQEVKQKYLELIDAFDVEGNDVTQFCYFTSVDEVDDDDENKISDFNEIEFMSEEDYDSFWNIYRSDMAYFGYVFDMTNFYCTWMVLYQPGFNNIKMVLASTYGCYTVKYEENGGVINHSDGSFELDIIDIGIPCTLYIFGE